MRIIHIISAGALLVNHFYYDSYEIFLEKLQPVEVYQPIGADQ
jgi:hypothetical protein